MGTIHNISEATDIKLRRHELAMLKHTMVNVQHMLVSMGQDINGTNWRGFIDDVYLYSPEHCEKLEMATMDMLRTLKSLYDQIHTEYNTRVDYYG